MFFIINLQLRRSTMKKAYGYIRVSGKGQIDGDGFARQEKAIADYAKANGYEIVKVYREEGVSGTLIDRPALTDMMLDLESNIENADADNQVKVVLIERVDRLARDLMIQENILHDLNKHGVDIYSACGKCFAYYFKETE
ncbi:MAG: recombinase family protein [Desulfamplus sp.]|nr:recombinase family protein [Desulfamplus sp.]